MESLFLVLTCLLLEICRAIPRGLFFFTTDHGFGVGGSIGKTAGTAEI
jgi:hypothetical protein